MSSSKLSISSLDSLTALDSLTQMNRKPVLAHGSCCGCRSCCARNEAASVSPNNASTSSSGSLGSLWKQPGGKGKPFTLTYSLTSGFLNGINGLPRWQVKAAVKKAFSVFAKYVPIRFVEIADRGPSTQALLNDEFIPAGNEAKLRFHRSNIDGKGNTIAEAYFPSEDSSIAGDLFFDNEDWDPGLFVETVLHELGHTLGMRHVEGVDAILNPTLKRRFSTIGSADLLPDDIRTIRRAYGTGKGSVKTLGTQPAPSSPNNPAIVEGTAGNEHLVGDDRNQRIYGRKGNDWLVGNGGRDALYGGPGSDRLWGGKGRDILVGAWNGRGEKDVLTGGQNNDLFVLGTKDRALYDDRRANSLGLQDYALVADFRRSEGDVIQLSDKFDYRLGRTPNGVDSGKAIFIDNPGGRADELIAVVRGLKGLGLNSGAFTYV